METVETRRTELVLSFQSVVCIYPALPTSRAIKSKANEDVLSEDPEDEAPAIVFVVKRKWSKKRKGPKAQKIPRYLFAYWGAGDDRRLCAIRTDVVRSADVWKSKQQAGPGIVMDGTLTKNDIGTLTCLISRKFESGSLYAISCRHVFSRIRQPGMTELSVNIGTKVLERKTYSDIAEVSGVHGSLLSSGHKNLDAQLARVFDKAHAHEQFHGLLFDEKYALHFGDVPDPAYIHLPSLRKGGGGAIRLKYVGYRTKDYPISYTIGGRDQSVRFPLIIVWKPFGGFRTIGGDSGSPITSQVDGGKLIAMHCGLTGNDNEIYSMPAWSFMNANMYGPLADYFVLHD